MASIIDLPQELIDIIIDFSDRRDCKALRATSSRFVGSSTPRVFREVHLSVQPQSLKSVSSIASKKRLARHVESLTLFPYILPKYDGYSDWMESSDASMTKFLYRKHGGREPISQVLYRRYQEYQRAVEIQQAFIAQPQFSKSLQRLIRSYPNLRSLDLAVHYHVPRKVQPEHLGGTLSSHDEFWSALDGRTPEGYEEYSFDVNAAFRPQNTYYNQSFLTQARLLGPSFLLPLLRASTKNRYNVQEVNFRINLLAQYDEYERTTLTSTQWSSDDALYHETAEQFHQAFRSSSADAVTSMCLDIQDGYDAEFSEAAMRSIGTFLNTAKSLVTLKLWMSPGDDNAEVDLLSDVSTAYMPHLRSLSLGKTDLYTSEDSLMKLLKAHAGTLKELELIGFSLLTGSWCSLIQSLPSTLRLSMIKFSNISDRADAPECEALSGLSYSYSGDPIYYYFAARESHGQEMFRMFILNNAGTSWPGWSTELCE